MMSLEEHWKELKPGAHLPAFRRVDESHVLDLYVGVDATGARVLLLLTDSEPPAAPAALRGVQIEKGQRSDGRWALTVTLRMPDLSKLFAHLCEDLVEASRIGCRPADGGRFVMERMSRWGRLLARGPQEGLNEQSYRGLVAELLVLDRLLIPRVGANVAISAWIGPLDADQDFRLADRLIEVKSTAVGSLTVTISSAEQLDVHGFPLLLIAVPIGDGTRGQDGTLKELVEAIRDCARSDGVALDMFNERLGLVGYRPQDDFANRMFGMGTMSYYSIAPDFPRISRSLVPAAIRTVRYQLDLSLCREFEVQELGD